MRSVNAGSITMHFLSSTCVLLVILGHPKDKLLLEFRFLMVEFIGISAQGFDAEEIREALRSQTHTTF